MSRRKQRHRNVRDSQRPPEPTLPPTPSETGSPTAPTLEKTGFSSLTELIAEHTVLVRVVGRDLLIPENIDRIKAFVQRAVNTGVVLEAREDRMTAHEVIGFWTAQVATASREQARADLKTGLSRPTATLIRPDFGNTLLRTFEPAALAGAIAAADRVLAGSEQEYRNLARLILLRLVRMKPDQLPATAMDSRIAPTPAVSGPTPPLTG